MADLPRIKRAQGHHYSLDCYDEGYEMSVAYDLEPSEEGIKVHDLLGRLSKEDKELINGILKDEFLRGVAEGRNRAKYAEEDSDEPMP